MNGSRFRYNNDKPVISTVGLIYLTLNTFMAAYRARDDPYTLAFIFTCFVVVMVFFWILDFYNRLPENSKEKERLKIWIWGLMTMINIGITYPFQKFLGPVWSWTLWGTVGITSLTVFCCFFVCPDEVAAGEALPTKAPKICVRMSFNKRLRV